MKSSSNSNEVKNFSIAFKKLLLKSLDLHKTKLRRFVRERADSFFEPGLAQEESKEKVVKALFGGKVKIQSRFSYK